MVRTAQTAVVAVAVSALVVLAGCSPAGGPAAAPPPTPAMRWAGSVCASVQALGVSLRELTARVSIVKNVPQTTLAQAKQQLMHRIRHIETDAASLASAVAAMPVPVSEPVRAAQQQLAASGTWRAAVAQIRAAAAALQSATTPAELVQRAAAATSAAAGAAGDLGAMSSALRRYAVSGQEELRQAFGNAPSCRALS